MDVIRAETRKNHGKQLNNAKLIILCFCDFIGLRIIKSPGYIIYVYDKQIQRFLSRPNIIEKMIINGRSPKLEIIYNNRKIIYIYI